MKKGLTCLTFLLLFLSLALFYSPHIVRAVDCPQNCGSGTNFCGCTNTPPVTCSDSACTQNCETTCGTTNDCRALGGNSYCSKFGASCPASSSTRQFFYVAPYCDTKNGNCQSDCPYFSCSVTSASGTSASSGTANSQSGPNLGDAKGSYDRIDWYKNGVYDGTTATSSGSGSNTYLGLSANTSYTATALYWTSNLSYPAINCSGSPSFLTKPAAPSLATMSASCPSPGTSVHIVWGNSPGGTSQYNLRINDLSDADGSGFNIVPYPPAGDVAFDNASQDNNYTTVAGHNYGWYVDACNSTGCTSSSNSNFICTATGPPKPTVTCSSSPNPADSGSTVTWTATPGGGSGIYNSFSWRYDDGTTTTTTTPSTTKTYTNTSSNNITKTAYVKVTDSADQTSNENSCTVAVRPPLSVTCTTSPSSTTTGQNVTWTANPTGGSGGNSFSWTGDANKNGTCTAATCNTSFTATGTKNSTTTVKDSNNNSATSPTCSATITSTAQPDLTVDSLSPTSATTGSSVSFSGRVRNTGSASAGASSTRLRYDSNRDGTLDTTPTNQSTGSLAAGGSETETWPSVTFSTAGNYLYEVCANTPASTSFTESNPNNNCTTATLTVSSTAPPPPPPPPPPSSSGCAWIQTVGGDVHSNTGINTPCGP